MRKWQTRGKLKGDIIKPAALESVGETRKRDRAQAVNKHSVCWIVLLVGGGLQASVAQSPAVQGPLSSSLAAATKSCYSVIQLRPERTGPCQVRVPRRARLLESSAERLWEPPLLFSLEVHCLLLEFFLIFCLDNLNCFLFCSGKLHAPDQFFLDYFAVLETPKRSQDCYFVGWPEGSEAVLFSFGFQVQSLLLMTVCTSSCVSSKLLAGKR